MQYRPEIDGLRALAVVPVILYHAGYGALSGGFVGVDVFFVISGYLITSILVREMDTGTYSISNFYARRARRLLPALLIVCAASIPAAIWLMPPGALAGFGRGLLATLLFASNIQFWSETGYFAAASDFKPLLHTWSLAIEEQFYVLFPLLLLTMQRLSRRQLIWVLFIGWLASFMIAGWASQNKPDANFYLLPSRAWELLTGSLIAVVPGLAPKSLRLRTLGAVAGVLAICLAATVYTARTPFPGTYALLPVLGAALIIVCSQGSDPMARILGWGGFVLIGKISYSLYLWHWPIFVFAKLWYFQGGPQPNFPILIALTVAAAWLSYKYIETPFRSPRTLPAMPAYSILGGASAVAAGFALLAVIMPSAFDRHDGPQLAALEATATYSPYRDTCHTRGRTYRPPSEACTYPGEDPTWAVFGDSHTVEFGYALSEALDERELSLSHHSFSGCAPMAGRSEGSRPGCPEWTEETLTWLANNQHIETIVVAYRLNAYLLGDHAAGYPRQPGFFTTEEQDAVWQSYLEALQRLSASGKQVIALMQVPEIPAPVEYMMRRTPDESGYIAGVPRRWWDTRQSWVYGRLGDIP
ncbi:MAG: acyltransferase family protein, partial [Pseudomonadota bacterium]